MHKSSWPWGGKDKWWRETLTRYNPNKNLIFVKYLKNNLSLGPPPSHKHFISFS